MKGAGAGDGAVFFEIRFVADNDKGNEGVVFDADNLVAEFVEFGEGGQGGYAEDEEEALARLHVEFSVRGTEIRISDINVDRVGGRYLMAAALALA